MDGSLLLIRRSRVRDPAGSWSYGPPPEGVRGEVRGPAAPMRPMGVPGAGPERPEDDGRGPEARLSQSPGWRILRDTLLGVVAWVGLCYLVAVAGGWLLRAVFDAPAVTP